MPIIHCLGCKSHPYQDITYGRGMRVANPCIKDGRLTGYRCAVCSAVISASIARVGDAPLGASKT